MPTAITAIASASVWPNRNVMLWHEARRRALGIRELLHAYPCQILGALIIDELSQAGARWKLTQANEKSQG